MNYINKLTYVSYDGFMEMDNLRNNYDSVLELDCKDITTEDKFWFYFGLYFNFPTRVDNWAAFSDWMRDLEFWDKSKSILIIFKNIDELFCRNLTLQSFVNVNIRMYNFDDVQCTVIPSVAYGFVTGMNLQLC